MSTSAPIIYLLPTCLIDTLFPDVARDAVRLLEAQGVHVNVPAGQTCCGQPAFNAGYWDEARRMARHTLDTLGTGEEPIVILSGSCGAMLTHYYQELFSDDSPYHQHAKRVAGRVVEFTQYLVDHLGLTDVGAALEETVAYHPSCHALRGMHINQQPRQLLSNVRGLRLVEQDTPETCCGFGGVFSVKMPRISAAMMNERLAAFEAAGADLVVGVDVSCLMHLEGGMRRRGSDMRTMHIASLLAEGLTDDA